MPTAAEPFGALRGRALHLPDADALVAADLHLGWAAASSVDAPLGVEAAAVDRLLALVEALEPATVALAGDVLHSFDAVPREAERALRRLREGVASAGATLVVVEGNHDAQLEALLGEPPEVAATLDDGTVVCHGHERPAVEGPRYVVGHDHPAIVIEGRRRPCALYGAGAFDGADVLCLPAFTPVARGTPVNGWTAGDPLSPLLADVARFAPVVWDADAGTPLVFPRLGALQSFL